MKNNGFKIGLLVLAVAAVGYTVFATMNTKEAPETEETNQTSLPESENKAEVVNKVKEANEEKEVVKPIVSAPKKEALIDNKVPFTSQAPTGNWDDERQQDGCEEASALMAVYWAQGKSLSSSIALEKILGASDYALEKHGEFRDISAEDTVQWIFKEYFKYDKVSVKKDVSIQDIITELEKGNIIVIPANGQKLDNPYFSPPGPERHMLVVRGYDRAKKQFITNDPGTKRGAAFRYNETVLYNAILSYETGHHEPVTRTEKDIIVVSK